ncbi:MAG: LuxR C-terminal-related transcriptional regulator [Phycisphaerales bacterium JB037]
MTLATLTDAALRLDEAVDLDELCAAANAGLSKLVACDWPLISLATTLLPNRRFSYCPVEGDWQRFADDSLTHAHEEPVYTSRLRLQLQGPASVTRMVDWGDLEPTRYYQEVWRPLGVRRLLRYLTPGLLSFRIELARDSDRDFSETDVAVVHALGRHLNASAERMALRHGGSLPVQGRLHAVQTFAWLVCDRSGRVQRADPAALARMRAAVGPGPGLDRIPPDWLAELHSRARGGPAKPFWHTLRGQPMSVHIAPIRPTPDEFSVGFLAQPVPNDPCAPLRALGLTSRQAEILHWVAQGKTNGAIGIILGISSLTVKKHLESVFHTLGVENRLAAAVVAFEAQRLAGSR